MEEQDVKDVQTQEVVEAATTEPEGETPQEKPEVEETEKPLSRAEIESLLTQKVEETRRHFQSIADRDVKKAKLEAKEAQQKATELESILSALKGDPRFAPKINYAETQAKLKNYQERELQEKASQEKAEFIDSYRDSLEKMGIEIDQIDWEKALSQKGPTAANKVIMSQAAEIVLAKQNELAKSLEAKTSQKIKDEIAKFRKEMGMDKVDESNPAGAGGSDAEFVKQFGRGEIPATRSNIERYQRIMNNY